MLTRKRALDLLDMVDMALLFMRFLRIWVRRLSFALKWFWPVPREMILPFFVTLSLFEYDLFVFMNLVTSSK